MSTILVDGASTAYGYYDAQYHGWANRLRLSVLPGIQLAPHSPIVVDNVAFPGKTITSLLRDASANLDSHTGRSTTLTSVLSVGINESKIMPGEQRPALGLNRFGWAVKRYVEYCDGYGAGVVLVGPQPAADETLVSSFTGATIERDLTEEYAEIMRSVADETGAAFVDAYALFGEEPEAYLSSDRVHPNALGHAVLYDAIQKELRTFGAL